LQGIAKFFYGDLLEAVDHDGCGGHADLSVGAQLLLQFSVIKAQPDSGLPVSDAEAPYLVIISFFSAGFNAIFFLPLHLSRGLSV
jgi:hypothetical protein